MNIPDKNAHMIEDFTSDVIKNKLRKIDVQISQLERKLDSLSKVNV